MLPLGVEDADPVQETFKLSRSGPILLVATRPVHVGHGEVRLPLPIIILRGVGLIRLTLLLVLLGISIGVCCRGSPTRLGRTCWRWRVSPQTSQGSS
jgi:hypothetical protein